MALAILAAETPERSDPKVGSITIRGHKMDFRRPEIAMFYGDDRAIDPEEHARALVEKHAPDYTGQKSTTIYLMGLCYVVDHDDKNADGTPFDPWAALADMEEKNNLHFLDLEQAFYTAFPDIFNWISAKAAAKNDSAEALAVSAPESSASPSPSKPARKKSP